MPRVELCGGFQIVPGIGYQAVATVRRDAAKTAVVDVERLRAYHASLITPRAEAVAEAGGWSVYLPGLPGRR